MPSINSARYAQRIIQTESHESPSFLRKVHRLDPPVSSFYGGFVHFIRYQLIVSPSSYLFLSPLSYLSLYTLAVFLHTVFVFLDTIRSISLYDSICYGTCLFIRLIVVLIPL